MQLTKSYSTSKRFTIQHGGWQPYHWTRLPPVEGYLLYYLKIPITGLYLYIEGTDIEFI